MRDAKVYDPEDIKALLAEKHGVDPKDVIKTQYSYVVTLKQEEVSEEKT